MAEDRQSETYSRPDPADEAAQAAETAAETGQGDKAAQPAEPAGEAGQAGDSAAPSTDTGESGGEPAPADEAAGEAGAEDPLVAEWRQRAEENYQRFLRVQADFENYRRRTMREKEELTQYASMKLIGELLPVLDNFQRALQAGAQPAQAAEGEGQRERQPDAAQAGVEAFRKGVEMIYRQLMQVLEAEGLKAMDPVGQPFDPALHQAVMQVPSDQYEEGIVVEVLQPGYWLKDKVLRPAMVKVSGA